MNERRGGNWVQNANRVLAKSSGKIIWREPEVNADAGERRKTIAEDISLSVPRRWGED